ncbi:MAG: hypothetical protein ACE5E8_07515 [Acidimicrobiia bacterium]
MTDAASQQAATPLAGRCSDCAGRLIATQVEPQLYVRRRGSTSGDTWSTTQLEAWTCLGCGRTDLYAAEPAGLAG